MQTSVAFKISIGLVICEEWMVLCDEGELQRVRLDMVGVFPGTDQLVAHDLLKNSGMPDMKQAVSIGFQPNSLVGQPDHIWILSKEAGYKLDAETLENDKEEITLLKFNLFKIDYQPGTPKDFMNQQYNLIVGSVDTDDKTENNGILRFYEVPSLSKPLVLIKDPYKGFGKIKDVVYRERK